MRQSATLVAALLASCGPLSVPRTCAPEDLDGFADEDGCADADNDLDRIADAEDDCPCYAEDRDGFQDADGCPDPDNDADQRVDACDVCPDEPETINGLDDLDGCPDEARIRMQDARIRIIPRIEFPPRSVLVDPAHHALLDEIAAAMRDYPQIELVEVQGHATPDESPNVAQRRADAVRDALIARGVDQERLVARSYGSDRPIAAHGTPDARARNRRVEVSILRAAEPPPAPAAQDPCPDGPPPPLEGVCGT